MKRNTYILIGILALLVVAAYLVMQKPGERSTSGDTEGELVTLDSLAVNKIEIKSPTGKVVLEKKGVEWYVEEPVSYRADQSNVASLIHQAKNLEVKSIVSDKPAKQSLFQVDSTGTVVRIFENGAEKASFVIGKAGSSYSETYARRTSSNDVALVSGAMSYIFNRAVREWRDRAILNVPKDRIKEVRFQYGDTTFVLAFKDSTWMVGRDSTQDWVVNGLLSTLSSLQADDFVDTLIFPSPKITAQLSYGGAQVSFSYVKTGDKYLVRSYSSPQWFEMQSWRANQALKRKKDLVKSGK
jgi:hypothetical protein